MFAERFFLEKAIQKQIEKLRPDFKGSDEEFQNSMKEKFPKAIEEISRGIIEEMLDYCISNKTDLKKRERKIIKSVKNKYGAAIQIFEAFIELNSKICFSSYEKYYKLYETEKDRLKLDTLISIFLKGCQIANEIKTLVANGYADGADARWRSLHELCVVFLFLYDSDYETIERFNNYEAIEAWKKAEAYKKSHEELGEEPLTDEESHNVESAYKEVIEIYGKEFEQEYGWAIKATPKGARNFRDIERLVGKEHLRVVYRLASENVHASVSGLRSNLGLKDNEQHYLLTGPIDYGFLDPVQHTANSLAEMSHTFLDMENSMMNKIFQSLLLTLQEDLVKEFQMQQEEAEKESELK